MRVFRLENMDGKGPFADSKALDALYRSVGHIYHSMLPTPWNDGLQTRSTNYCGCERIEQVRSTWFPSACHSALEAEGFSIVEFEVPDYAVQKGKCQVLFEKAEAQVVALHPLGEMQ